jgi:uncharacterized repeat protein (TIGR04052 family)
MNIPYNLQQEEYMRFTDRQWHARLWGLALLCVGPVSACEEDEEPADRSEEDEGGGSSSSGSRSSRSSRRQVSQRDVVAECKDACDDECGDCKAECEDEDDEDCNHACDNDRYACRKACEKLPPPSAPCDDACDDACDDSCDDACPRTCGDAGTPDPDPDPDDDDEVAVTIKFAARVGDEKFACGETYAGVGTADTEVTPTDLRFFVQDVELITTSGKAVPVKLDVRKPWQSKDVVLLDFEDGSGECGEGNEETNVRITGTVPRGSYSGIRFSNGVPEALNHADPADAVDPLAEFDGLSWGWLGGFRFTKVEVREVTDADEWGCAVAHIGSTACTGNPQAGTVECGKPNRNLVELDNFDADADIIVFDVAKLFAETDVSEMSECHSTGSSCNTMFEAFGVNLKTGEPLNDQSVFSVE